MPAPNGSPGSATMCAPTGPDHGLGGQLGRGPAGACGLPAEGDRHTNPVRKLRTLADDLNLTSKLEYGAQPLLEKPQGRAAVPRVGGAILRARGKKCEIALEQQAGRHTLRRPRPAGTMLENLMNNSIRHNPGRVSITVRTSGGGCFA